MKTVIPSERHNKFELCSCGLACHQKPLLELQRYHMQMRVHYLINNMFQELFQKQQQKNKQLKYDISYLLYLVTYSAKKVLPTKVYL